MRIKSYSFVCLLLVLVYLTTACSLVENSTEKDGVEEESTTSTQPDNDPSSGDGALADESTSTNEGTLVIRTETIPANQAGTFRFTGVPTGTISSEGTLVVSNLSPGTYTSTEINPEPDFDLADVECDDDDSSTPSSGDPSTRTAVFNLDPGETVTCTFTNAQRGSLVIIGQSAPDGAAGSFQFTGVPSGTIPANGTLVVSNLTPGTYSSTEVDPAPEFDLTAVECDDRDSSTPSSSDPSTRTAVFNLDPGEIIRCTFTNTRRGSVVISGQTIPEDATGNFQFTGVPSGTISANGTLVAADLAPGTYTSTEVDPAPDFELTTIICDDEGSQTASSADPSTRTAVFNLDPGEQVTCTFINSQPADGENPILAGGGSSGNDNESGGGPGGGDGTAIDIVNPFDDPDQYLSDFPFPVDAPADAGTFAAPKPGPWEVTNFEGQVNCDNFSMPIPASPTETGTLEVLDGGQTIIGTSLQDAQEAPITLMAVPGIRGRYEGAFEGIEQGTPVTFDYFWQVVTDEYIVGFISAAVDLEGASCNIYRAFEMNYTG